MNENELDQGVGGPAATGNDPEFAGWQEGVEDAPRVGGIVVPTFGYYVVELLGAQSRFSKNKGTPSARIGVRILEGIDGGVGENVWDDLYLAVSKEKALDGKSRDAEGNLVMVAKSPEEYAKSIAEFQKGLNKVARVFGLPRSRPTGKTEAEIDLYTGQFVALAEGANKPKAVVEITVEARQGFQPRNRIHWMSLRALTEKAVGKAGADKGQNAYAEAKAKIEERKTAAGKAGAAALRRAAPAGNAAGGLD